MKEWEHDHLPALDKDLKGYIAARSFAREIGDEIVSKIKVGMTEKGIEEVASLVFNKNGIKQHWHMPTTSSNNTLMNGLWTIEPYLIYKERAAKFEQPVFIGKETVIL